MTNQIKVQILEYGQMTHEVIVSSVLSPSPCCKRKEPLITGYPRVDKTTC